MKTKKPKLINKKGGLVSLTVLIILLLALGFVWVVTYNIFSTLRTDIFDNPESLNTSYSRTVSNDLDKTLLNYDVMYVIFAVLVSAGIIMGGIFLDTHPALFILSIILFIIVVWIGGSISNAFYEITQTGNNGIVTAATNFPMTLWIMNHLPIWITVMGGLTLIILYGKFQSV